MPWLHLPDPSPTAALKTNGPAITRAVGTRTPAASGQAEQPRSSQKSPCPENRHHPACLAAPRRAPLLGRTSTQPESALPQRETPPGGGGQKQRPVFKTAAARRGIICRSSGEAGQKKREKENLGNRRLGRVCRIPGNPEGYVQGCAHDQETLDLSR